MLTHRGMCMNAFVSGSRMGLRAGDRFHSVRPFFHVAGSTLSVLASAQHLTTLVTMSRFEPGAALRVLEQERCTHLSGNDTIALMLLNHPDLPQCSLSLRGAWVAASGAIVERIIDDLGASEVVVGYGLSEASPNIAQSAWYEPRAIRVSTAMTPQPGVDVRIWKESEALCAATGQSGEIQVRGWNVMLGYFDEPELTAAAFTEDGWLRTGDLGRLDESGRLTFLGRAKEIIRVGGENVAPAEIEDLLHRHPAVKQAVVVGVEDPRLLEVPFAFVVLNEAQVCTEAELIEWTMSRISGFKVPRYVRIMETFEDIGLTASSKVQKTKLAAYAAEVLGGRAS
jgi:fatty-acyl-CoA synthase